MTGLTMVTRICLILRQLFKLTGMASNNTLTASMVLLVVSMLLSLKSQPTSTLCIGIPTN